MNPNAPVVAAWGGGVNSTAMILEWVKRGLRLDLVLFADTGGEKPETYAFRDTFAEWLKGKAPFYTVVGNYKYPTLEAECLGSGTLPSIAYGYKRCSLKWKRSPQDIFCNNWQPAKDAWAAGLLVTKLLGYDAGEHARVARSKDDEKYHYVHPLYDWDIDRKGCVKLIEESGLPTPPKSSCFFCPHSRAHEILQLQKDHPDLLDRALKIEENARAGLMSGGVAGLGRTFSWRSVIKTDACQLKLFGDFDKQMPCDCFDGGDDE